MRVVSLEPFLSELVAYLGAPAELVGVSFSCDYPEELKSKVKLRGVDDWSALKALTPDVILTSIKDDDDSGSKLKALRQAALDNLGDKVKVFSYAPRTLNEVFDMFESVGKVVGAASRGHDLAQRLKAQVMDWCDNFYSRMHNKKISFISNISPLTLAGDWIPDLIHLCSAVSQVRVPGKPGERVDFKQIVDFRPDVIIVAPIGYDLQQTLSTFKILEKLPGWEDVPAVKRGEVAFAEGRGLFYRPGPRLLDSMGIMISAIAGFESGYITPRDSFYRLRWLEMQRHRF